MSIFKLPDLGEGLPDAEISEWYVKVGDTVKTDQNIVSMETAKAVVDVPAPQDGVIKKLYGEPGDIIKTGSALVEFESSGSEAKETETESVGEADKGTVVGNIQVSSDILQESATGVATQKVSSKTKALPAVRILARKLNVDLNALTGSGANGMITEEDVLQAAGQSSAKSSSKVNVSAGGKVDPLRGVRRAMANAMVQSHQQIVPVTIVDDADIHGWKPGNNITLRVIRALCTACEKEPALNAHFDFDALERHLFSEVHLGIAMDSGDGLFVPVIKNAHKLAPKELRDAIEQYKQQVKAREVAPQNLQGSTIQLSNFGTFAGRYANPILVPPLVAIIGTGRLREEVVPENGQPAIHKILPLSVTIDHRAITGGEAARFLAAMIEDLQAAE